MLFNLTKPIQRRMLYTSVTSTVFCVAGVANIVNTERGRSSWSICRLRSLAPRGRRLWKNRINKTGQIDSATEAELSKKFQQRPDHPGAAEVD